MGGLIYFKWSVYLLRKHRRTDTRPAKRGGLHSFNREGHSDCMSTLRPTHTSHAHYALHAAMQAGGTLEWIPDLRPVFEVHWGREWEVMDLCVMTCFTGTLPFSVTPAHLWCALQILILFIQSWQPRIIPPPPISTSALSLSILLSLSLRL